ncbi:MAG: DNA-directed RNA polymerase subunit alpha C-terminal domain-containing protein [Minicystis sp.]
MEALLSPHESGSPSGQAHDPVAPAIGAGPVLDPRIDALPFRHFVRQWAAAQGITTLRQLARVPPASLLADRSALATSTEVAHARGLIEHFLGRTWEELVAREEPREPPRIEGGSRRPVCWDELRLVLPEALRARRLSEIALPARMQTCAERAGIATLGELAERSEEQLMEVPRLGRLTIHRTFLAIRAFSEHPPAPAVPELVAMPELAPSRAA